MASTFLYNPLPPQADSSAHPEARVAYPCAPHKALHVGMGRRRAVAKPDGEREADPPSTPVSRSAFPPGARAGTARRDDPFRQELVTCPAGTQADDVPSLRERKTRVFVGVGSSLEPEVHVPAALARLDEAVGLLALSTFYLTPALGRPSDPPFVNGAAEVPDALAAGPLKALLGRIEEAEGRRRGGDRFAPRPIDLDLLLHGDLVSIAPDLPLPHPGVARRRFVALPLLELAPDLELPGSRARLSTLVEAMPAHPMEPMHGLTRYLRRRFLDEPRQG
jgi:2-amino-4-hydroxy-6-hydroxymethyldihydropteridine diphosphokinase